MRTPDEHRPRHADPRARASRDADGQRRCRPASAARSGSRARNLIRGYWNKPEATAETIVDGWLRTGDLGRLDDEGFVYVEDRAKDMVLRGGENVYCAEVEAAIYEHPAVHEAAVFGVPHERLGEEVAAAVVPRAGHDARPPRSCRPTWRERLAPFKVPHRVARRRPSPCPATPAGKFLKRDLRERMTS